MPSPAIISAFPSGNRLLDSLPLEDFAAMRHLFHPYALRMRETLQESGEPSEHVYFPTSGIISLLTVLENGSMIEFATVGREGTTGVPLVLHIPNGSSAVISQLSGDSLRLSAKDFTEQIRDSPSFAVAVLRYAGVLLALTAQSAACNRAHSVAERCARWLLMTHDQARVDEFDITQEFLAQMLGVGRSSVTEVAGSLQEHGIVRYHHGRITILDRFNLEEQSCECYLVIREHLDSLPNGVEKATCGVDEIVA